MIPEVKLIKKLVSIKNVKVINKNFKYFLANNIAKPGFKIYNCIFNRINNNKVFNHVLALDIYFNNVILTTEDFELINNFNLLVFTLIPKFDYQIKKNQSIYSKIDNFIATDFDNKLLNQWNLESIKKEVLFLNNTFLSKVSNENLIKIKKLTHMTGKLFAKINNNETYYEFGYLLTLYFLLNFETKVVSESLVSSNWNLTSSLSYDSLFVEKLYITEQLNEKLMKLNNKKFNLYWRVINYVLNGSFLL